MGQAALLQATWRISPLGTWLTDILVPARASSTFSVCNVLAESGDDKELAAVDANGERRNQILNPWTKVWTEAREKGIRSDVSLDVRQPARRTQCRTNEAVFSTARLVHRAARLITQPGCTAHYLKMVVSVRHLHVDPTPFSRISQLTSSSASTAHSYALFKFQELEDELDGVSSISDSDTMDPTYVTSGPGAVLQCLTLCSASLAQLQHLQREYHSSPPATLEALLVEVRQVARSLSGINTLFYDPERDVAAALESNMDLQQLFDGVLRPTRIIFASLEQEMRGLFLPAYDQNAREDDTKARARYLFTDNVLKNYLSMVRTDRSVLTMLSSALQM
jgi:hypothetical protein